MNNPVPLSPIESSDQGLTAQTPRCPVSRSSDVSLLCCVDAFEIWRCPQSSTDFVWPMPSDASLKMLYDREAWFEGGEYGGYEDYDTQTAPSLAHAQNLLQRFKQSDRPLKVLDVGCGYGSHLRLAADDGWSCFGVEPSKHAREVARKRHGDLMTIVETVGDLLPMQFDLIFMFEVIEHLKDPYALFFDLFGRDAIGPHTLIAISTPNARCTEATKSPGTWQYRHPPSHLVYYSAKSIQLLLQRLLFTDIQLSGVVEQGQAEPKYFADEEASVNDTLTGYSGVVAYAKGSTFKAFMHERYVPGAFWKLTEYEHFPRYAFAAQYANNAHVLDFGCGTGYGAMRLSQTAASVTGLDISEEAIQWARAMHKAPNLQFEVRSDLGRGLEAERFDLVTCFEMIEHVDHATQIATIQSIAGLLKRSGKLVISTPDPAFTADYGPNPYHLREMNIQEFSELLTEEFAHVLIVKQWVRPSVVIGNSAVATTDKACFTALSSDHSADAPIGFVAICSHEPFEPPPYFCQFDTKESINRELLETEHKLNRLRFENFNLLTSKLQVNRERDDLARWLGSQQEAWEKSTRELTLEKQHAIAAAQDALTWMTSQRDAWEQLAQQNATSLENVQKKLKSTQQHLANITEKLSAVQNHWAFRIVNFVFGRKYL